MRGEDAVAWFLVALAVAALIGTVRASLLTSSVGRRWSMRFASVTLVYWAFFYVFVHFNPSFAIRRDISRGAVVFTIVTFMFQAWAVIKSEPSNGAGRE